MRFLSALAAATWVLAPAAHAKVTESSDSGFVVAHTARVAAKPDEVWKTLRMPDKWWSKAHTWSGDAANLWMDTQAGGCFCEKLPRDDGTFGSVQHARILYADAGKLLRLSGGLGPLQSEAVTGTLTVVIQSNDKGSTILFEYVVGGYARFPMKTIAPAVDTVIGEQLAGLAKALGGALPVGDAADKAAPAAKATTPPAPAAKPADTAKPAPVAPKPAAPAAAPKPAIATTPKPAATPTPKPAPTTTAKPVDPAKPKP
jgi:uncharacterized protein YndB with AHSA1/START domain